ncbi:MAG TPA: hypothetical protein VE974_27155 [Thermoanaerobaculia bacterium]|nr:hypothetical protein [Thermoanaerobaculia bacterium]
MAPTSQPIIFTVHDNLGPGQIAEQVTLLIDGTIVGTLNVSSEQPSATLTVKVPEAGRYSWSAEAQAIFAAPQGQTFTHTGVGPASARASSP